MSSIEVEDCLCSHPAVAEAAVIGVPDEKWGETVKALVVLAARRARRREAELIEHCRGRPRALQVPDLGRVRDALARTATGKLQKFKLREPYWEGTPGSSTDADGAPLDTTGCAPFGGDDYALARLVRVTHVRVEDVAGIGVLGTQDSRWRRASADAVTSTDRDAITGPSEASGPLPAVGLPSGGDTVAARASSSRQRYERHRSLTVSPPTSPARGDFAPKLMLTYDSGAGNGPFGLGWQLG